MSHFEVLDEREYHSVPVVFRHRDGDDLHVRIGSWNLRARDLRQIADDLEDMVCSNCGEIIHD